ncbi:MAG: hypothetical protein JXA90_11980 [Planctomycetes bacterium]|nr:hypothetical protein [Planctomycetota bacterium]
MLKLMLIAAPLLALAGSCAQLAADIDGLDGPPARYKALAIDVPARGTWAILDRDGANRKVDPYLSSLGLGELGTGTISSPSFALTVDQIRFTIRGHDGAGGGQGENVLVLIDNLTGKELKRTAAPGSDDLQERFWRVADLKWREVRIEARDGIAAGAFAWLGVGEIDAGPQHRFDFRKGMATGWKQESPPRESVTEVIPGAVPFRALKETAVPAGGAVEIPCGFQAGRLFLLGCTVASGRPLEVHGHVEIRYEGGETDRIPLMVGYTLEGQFKLLSPSDAMRLRPSGDPFQYYLAIEPRPRTIDAIRIEAHPDRSYPPSITAITCETTARAINLEPLAAEEMPPEEEAWIDARAISSAAPLPGGIEASIRAAHKLPAERE